MTDEAHQEAPATTGDLATDLLTDVVDLDDVKRDDLVALAKDLGVPHSGTKAELAEEIRGARAETSGEPDFSPEEGETYGWWEDCEAVGLVLIFPGAPATSHNVGVLPGLYRPDRPHPVGSVGEPTLAQAVEAHQAANVPLRLVQINQDEVDALRAAAADDRRVDTGQRS